MHNLELLMWTTLKLFWGFGTMSQSKLSLWSIMTTVTQVRDGLLGTNQASAECLPASTSPPTVHINGLSLPSLQNIWVLDYPMVSSTIYDELLSRIALCKVEQGYNIFKLWNAPLIQCIASWTCCVLLIFQRMVMCGKLSLAIHLCTAQSLFWINTDSHHSWKNAVTIIPC